MKLKRLMIGKKEDVVDFQEGLNKPSMKVIDDMVSKCYFKPLEAPLVLGEEFILNIDLVIRSKTSNEVLVFDTVHKDYFKTFSVLESEANFGGHWLFMHNIKNFLIRNFEHPESFIPKSNLMVVGVTKYRGVVSVVYNLLVEDDLIHQLKPLPISIGFSARKITDVQDSPLLNEKARILIPTLVIVEGKKVLPTIENTSLTEN